ncbi:ribosome maturation factor RimP [Acidiferrobacter sp.]|uniref:ribosome maturation factor RimP n=1 Tax=Acidiferrobacter sp. TaxID=1872107 RepID=UPI0026109454|nr:ribosome maturation factor RimP [Acidiferrobacter sp.]
MPTFAFMVMEKRVQTDRLRALVEPALAHLGFEVVDIEFVSGQKTLRIYIDRPQGVDVDDCARVSRQVSALFDVEDPIPGQYTLEISSPGLDRPLVRPGDFARFAGSLVKLKTMLPVDGRRNFQGRLVGLIDGRVILKADETRYDLAFENIEKARLVPEL